MSDCFLGAPGPGMNVAPKSGFLDGLQSIKPANFTIPDGEIPDVSWDDYIPNI